MCKKSGSLFAAPASILFLRCFCRPNSDDFINVRQRGVVFCCTQRVDAQRKRTQTSDQRGDNAITEPSDRDAHRAHGRTRTKSRRRPSATTLFFVGRSQDVGGGLIRTDCDFFLSQFFLLVKEGIFFSYFATKLTAQLLNIHSAVYEMYKLKSVCVNM